MIGKTLAHYEVISLLGKGGMGEVYRARDTKLQREVALKFLPPDFALDADRLQRFEREARLLAALSHPNVATIHGFEQAEDLHFLVMELIEGEDLSERLNRERIRTADALDIARKIAAGMEAAHARGIIHRDLKPANIKLTPDGGVRILDFGLARTNEPKPMDETVALSQTVEGTILGTAPYMSPEQLKGQLVDARTDIWAFGCVLYEMLTGNSPYAAESSPETLARILAHEPEFERLPKDLPPSAFRALRRCLEKDARNRWHSIADVRIELDDIEEPVTPDTKPSSSRSRITLLALAAFALGAVVTGALVGQNPSSDIGEPARLMIPVRDQAAVVPLPESTSVTISPDGKQVVYVASTIAGARSAGEFGFENTQLYTRQIDSFDTAPLEGTEGGSSPFFSPDGQWIGFLNFHDGTVRKVPRTGGAAATICHSEYLTFRGVSWAEDGNIYFSNALGIYRVSESGGEPQVVIEPDVTAGEKTYRFPHTLPGTRSMLVMRASPDILSYDDAEILLLDLDSGELSSLITGGMDPQYVESGHILYGRDGKAMAIPFDLQQLQVTGRPIEVIDRVVTSSGYGSLQLDCSTNGTLVYIAGGPEQFESELLILRRDGTVEETSQETRPYGNVSLSPDADRLAVSVLGANASVWVFDFQRDTMTRLVSGWDNFSPVWTRDGREIAYGSNLAGVTGAMITSADGSGSPRQLIEFPSDTYPMSFLPTDTHLAVATLTTATGMDIMLVGRDGTVEPLVQTPARELRAQFSSDGRYLLYTSDESGRLEIYVAEFPITGRKWKLSTDGGDMPKWSRDGRTVYYWSGQKLMMVPIEIGETLRPARAATLLELEIEVQDYDVFPDEDRFIVLARRRIANQVSAGVSRPSAQGRMFAAQSPDLHVVLNWFTELQRLAP